MLIHSAIAIGIAAFAFSPFGHGEMLRHNTLRRIPTPPPHPTLRPVTRPTWIPALSPTITMTPKPTVALTPAPTSTPKPTVTLMPTPMPTGTTTDTVQSYIMNAINNYRQSLGLSRVSMDTSTCTFASIRAREIVTDFSHAGFESRISSKTLPYPSYTLVTENLAMNPDYTNVVSSWINSPGHAANMRADTPYVCVVRDGNYYAYEGWKP